MAVRSPSCSSGASALTLSTVGGQKSHQALQIHFCPTGIGLELSIAPPRSMERHILGRAFGERLPTLNLYLVRAC